MDYSLVASGNRSLAARRAPRVGALLLGLLVLVVATGCASVPMTDTERSDAFSVRQEQLDKLERWEATGRIGVVAPGNSFTANVEWRQTGESYWLRLSGPLGQGAAELEGRPGHVTLTDADGKITVAATADDLLRASQGWELPVGGLRHWLLGGVDPQAAFEVDLDEEGRPRQLRQHGWQIDYQSYSWTGELDLPRRLRLRRADISARALVSRWSIPQ